MSEFKNIYNPVDASTGFLQPKVLIAPLNWGLGHASRCVPIIHFLLENGFEPVLASDGEALLFLRKEFPNLAFLELPPYQIRYSNRGIFLKWKLLMSAFKIKKAAREEELVVANYLRENKLVGIISDNRFGVRHSSIPSVYITHQINVLSGVTTTLTSKIHKKIISKFTACWVPDVEGVNSLSGKLSEYRKDKMNPVFLGSLSRLVFKKVEKVYDILVLLSGPEPQRTLLEEKLTKELFNYQGKVLLVRGVVEDEGVCIAEGAITKVGCLLTADLEEAINASSLVIARSGYSSVMDLAKLKKKAFFIPTPGQSEQEYLAKYLAEKKIAPFCSQQDFKITLLEKMYSYTGFVKEYHKNLDKSLLCFFQSK